MRTIARAGRLLWRRGWADECAGNISVALARTPLRQAPTMHFIKFRDKLKVGRLAGSSILFTAAGSDLRDLTRGPQGAMAVITVSDKADGYFLHDPGIKPTSEIATHLFIHNHFGRKGKHRNLAVIHCHAARLVALARIDAFADEKNYNRVLSEIYPGYRSVLPRGVGLVEYEKPGSAELARATAKSIRYHRLVVWKEHGCIAAGDTVESALDLIDVANKAASIFFLKKRRAFPGKIGKNVKGNPGC